MDTKTYLNQIRQGTERQYLEMARKFQSEGYQRTGIKENG